MSVEQPSGSDAVAAQAPAPTMISQVPFPPRLELKSNLAKTWKSWKQLWDGYETVTRLNEKDSKLRVATFVTVLVQMLWIYIMVFPFKMMRRKEI